MVFSSLLFSSLSENVGARELIMAMMCGQGMLDASIVLTQIESLKDDLSIEILHVRPFSLSYLPLSYLSLPRFAFRR